LRLQGHTSNGIEFSCVRKEGGRNQKLSGLPLTRSAAEISDVAPDNYLKMVAAEIGNFCFKSAHSKTLRETRPRMAGKSPCFIAPKAERRRGCLRASTTGPQYNHSIEVSTFLPVAYSIVVRCRSRQYSRSLLVATLTTVCVVFASVCVFAAAPSSGVSDREAIEDLSPPWSAIGQVNVAGYRSRIECTGSLIASNVVITAAHCVMDPWHQKPFADDEIHFLAGVRKSKWLAHSTARCLHFLPDYQYSDHSLVGDVVLITLADDIKSVPPVQLDASDVVGPNVSLVHAAYTADRRYLLTAQFGCHLIAHDLSLWLTDCNARPASSGGPVFTQTKDGLRLAAVMVGVGPKGSLAVPITKIPEVSSARSCP
jgi:protease YdgD